MLDAHKIQFTSTEQVDKIVIWSSSNDGGGGLGGGGHIDISAASVPIAGQAFTANITNPYGRKLLPTVSWSTDGVIYYPGNQPLYYFNSGAASYLWQALATMGCSDSQIYFYIYTQYDQAQRIYFQFALDSIE